MENETNKIDNKIISFNCSKCRGVCDNYANNLMILYFDYWLSKVTINKDEKGFLENIFDILNFKRMKNGITCLVLDYFINDVVIANMLGLGADMKWDHNGKPIGARVQIIQNNYDFKEIYVMDWKLFKPENETLKNAYLKQWGWSNSKIYKTIFFINNYYWESSLKYLNKILYNIHELDEINDKNHCLINKIYIFQSDKKPTPEEANNAGITFSNDGFGMWVYDWNTNAIDGNQITKEIKFQNLSNWNGIKDEFKHWKEEFFEFAGIPTEKLSNQRENISETVSRYSRVNAKEKQYYKYIEQFLKEYEEYFNIKLEYEFDNLIQNSTNLAINNQNNTFKKLENDIDKIEMEDNNE